MHFNLSNTIEILERTPSIIEAMLSGLSDAWTTATEGPNTFSPYDVVGHLIHGEKADWITRMDIILSDSPDRKFQPFDRFAQFEESKGKTLDELLKEFRMLRQRNIAILKSKNLQSSDFDKTGVHPVFGEVTLAQLLSTWVAHDLNHIFQISRVMAKQYKTDVGPWVEYLKILRS
ncbi:MAG: DinB family protein [candidate division Zixibacteria bacterium]|nr:DinB family protein [candidate division Zixibacteria bacterium]